LLQGNGVVDPYNYTRAVVAAAQALGAERVDGEVNDIVAGSGRIEGLLLGNGTLQCGAVVFATGPWVSRPASWLGIRIPVEPVKGQLLYARMHGISGRHDLTWGLHGIFQLENGLVVLGGTEERVGFDLDIDESGRVSILQGICRMIGSVGGIEILSHRAAARPVSSEQLPIIGRAPGWDNAYIATGAGRKGVLYSSGMGCAIAEQATNGSSSVAVAQCSMSNRDGFQ